MCVQIDGNNVTTNETYVAGTVAVYKCIDSHDRIVNAGGLKEYSRNCDTLTRSWNGTLPTCGQSSFMKLIDIKFPLNIDEPLEDMRCLTRQILHNSSMLNLWIQSKG